MTRYLLFAHVLYFLGVTSRKNDGDIVHQRISKLPVIHRTEPDVTVSGQSAGAGIAVQLHVAFSDFIVGAALFAGAPYYCARSQLKILVEQCTIYGTPNDDTLELLSKQWSSLGAIDDVKNLLNDRVYLYHGTADTVLDLPVVQSLETYYSALIDNSTNGEGKIETFYTLDAEHSTPTIEYGAPCETLEKPFLGKCNFDGTGAAFNTLYDSDTLSRGQYLEENLFQFDQRPYMNFTRYKTPAEISMGENGYIYIPRQCQGNHNAHCRLHVAMHGCNQNLEVVGNVYAAHAGYNHWGEDSGIVILYPYAVISENDPYNIKGCWDWWGYTGPDYGLKSGVQMEVVSNMIKSILPRMVTLENRDRGTACHSKGCYYSPVDNGYICSSPIPTAGYIRGRVPPSSLV